ncbi:MAG TPA: 23S rRNA (pseudouridine(1915)-N(3))-methyltransferase RlmH [Taishania sp.]|nr:23S rRNA (pseudouridine(1915)-N(3))-methyltransferase RlmH [Taishania sp.]HNS41207.1 23S rRNA (pseudouridine(1915)-N(3))-methyltransferase RlmH [Taishania sp.]
MKITFICIGKTSKKFLEEGEQEYLNRLKNYTKIERIELPDLKNARKLTLEQIKKEEGQLFLSKIPQGDELILLDERGKHYSSVEFSKFIDKKNINGVKGVTFLVGGAYGFSDEIYARTNSKMSLSTMTFSHQMIRMIFFEQLYRAFTIIKGEPYHHE